MLRIYPFFLAVFFFASFIFSIVNISVGGLSVYFFLFIPLLDFLYLKRFFYKKYTYQNVLYGVACFFSCLAVSIYNVSAISFLKVILIFLVVNYIYYLYIERYTLFRLFYFFVMFSVCFSIFQFFITYWNGSELVQPYYLSKLIWGDYAIQSRAGFDDGLLFQYRVAGLSKEPGFFSSLLLSSLAVYSVDKKYKSNFFILCVLIGIILSLSKITLAFSVLVPFIYLFNRYVINLNKIDICFGSLFLIVFISFFINVLYFAFSFIELVYANPWLTETYLHRSIGWYILPHLFSSTFFDIFFFGGATEHLKLFVKYFDFLTQLRFVYIQPSVVFFSSNHAYVILQYGFIFFVLLLMFLRSIHISFYTFLIFTVLVSNVNMFSFENWVVLGFLFMLISRVGNSNLKYKSLHEDYF